MFENIGQKCKTLAKVIAVLGIVGSIIAGAVVGYTVGRFSSGSGFLMFLLYAGVGSLVSWLGSWSLYAIGEAADNSSANRDLLTELLQRQDKSNWQTIHKKSVPELKKSERKQHTDETVSVTADNGTVTCPICGSFEDFYPTRCSYCLVSFDYEVDESDYE
ncbi:MAG: hypothetical protein LBN30_08635 [Oscillospiraceae bacterium]|jgi:hypothetical protein|nr:hypothetical protein [Oscillospiraceae bacterium]